MAEMTAILEAILAGDTSADDYAALQIPASYRAVTVRKDEVGMFDGLESRDKDPRKSLHVDTAPLPAGGAGDGLIAVKRCADRHVILVSDTVRRRLEVERPQDRRQQPRRDAA